MYRSSELEKQNELRNAISPTEYSTQSVEKSFDDLLLTEEAEVSEMAMPSATTLEYVDYKGEEYDEVQEIVIPKEKYSISTRGKVLIAVYAFILLAIFAVIIFNATYLRGLDKKIQKAQQDVAVVQQLVDAKTMQLEEVSSQEAIEKAAEKLGMELI